eukprot:CAMPEP_0181175160 /NCGR_PEP_ID=MMETSP1096-20121128/3925_1 /TAXON_ID=156174 ORGANISM="Chrysochromulina ericina, Strain CCMP281" /NCGR_SAMPLE_ID=MMETSP1096 /ASSEMBLY_ACC=CAM_ASM_000453 /LENGTH=133 /DNA_ID=CAMNT_0023263117 /DNA_START=53 /DNA_END=455 /DNA_ORIENTATION=+
MRAGGTDNTSPTHSVMQKLLARTRLQLRASRATGSGDGTAAPMGTWRARYCDWCRATLAGSTLDSGGSTKRARASLITVSLVRVAPPPPNVASTRHDAARSPLTADAEPGEVAGAEDGLDVSGTSTWPGVACA